MLLGSVEESGYQHARLTIWTILFNRLSTKSAKQQIVWIHLSNLTCSFCFQCKSLHMLCHSRSEWTIPGLMQCFSNFRMSCIIMCSFENQSSQVQLITLKAPTCPTSYEWGWICYLHSMIFNLKYYHTQMIHSKLCTTFTHVLAYETHKWSKLQKPH